MAQPKMLWVGSAEINGMLLILITRRKPPTHQQTDKAAADNTKFKISDLTWATQWRKK